MYSLNLTFRLDRDHFRSDFRSYNFENPEDEFLQLENFDINKFQNRQFFKKITKNFAHLPKVNFLSRLRSFSERSGASSKSCALPKHDSIHIYSNLNRHFSS